MLLIDDPDRTVIEPLTAAAGTMEKLYDFDLMQGGGHIRGYKLSDTQMDAVAASLEGLTSDEAMQKKYGVSGAAPLLFAVGDGNHSLATAKACYEERRRARRPRSISRCRAASPLSRSSTTTTTRCSSSRSTACSSAWTTRSS